MCKPPRLVSVTLANKIARIAWASLARSQTYVAEISMTQQDLTLGNTEHQS